MMARVAIGAALMLAAAGYSGTLAQSRAASDALLGRWDLVVQRGTQTSPSWLEVERSGTATLVGQFVGSGGSARPIAKIEFTDGTFRFAIPPQWESNPRDITFEGRLEGDRITGSMTMGDGQKLTWSGTRAPSLRRTGTAGLGRTHHALQRQITRRVAAGRTPRQPVERGRRHPAEREQRRQPRHGSEIRRLQAAPGVPRAERIEQRRVPAGPLRAAGRRRRRPRAIVTSSRRALRLHCAERERGAGLPASGNRWMSRSWAGCSRTS